MIIIYVSEAIDRHATMIFDLMQFSMCNHPIEQNITRSLKKSYNTRVLSYCYFWLWEKLIYAI